MPQNFNKALSATEFDCGVHFYIDDYQFERVWRMPERYLPILKRFRCVVAPDFSIYNDVPMVVNQWNLFRSRFRASYWQRNGVKVIPNVPITPDEATVDIYSGMPESSVIAFGCMKANKNLVYHRMMMRSVRRSIDKLAPSKILVYGHRIAVSTNVEIVFVENDNLIKLKQWKTREKQSGKKKESGGML